MSNYTFTHKVQEALLTINHVFAGLAVADYEKVLVWYKLLFGRSPDVIVTENESMWQLTETGWVYVVGDANRVGSSTLLTILVNNLEDLGASLGERGLETSAIETVPGSYRKAVITDPEGNMISFDQDLSTHN